MQITFKKQNEAGDDVSMFYEIDTKNINHNTPVEIKPEGVRVDGKPEDAVEDEDDAIQEADGFEEMDGGDIDEEDDDPGRFSNEEAEVDDEDGGDIDEEEEDTVNSEVIDENTVLTEEQVKAIAEDLDNLKKESKELADVAALPSNNNVEYHDPEDGNTKQVMCTVNPVTGEKTVLGEADEDYLEDQETFEDMLERIESSDIEVNNDPFNEEELESTIKNKENKSLFAEISKDVDLDPETIKQLLVLTNKKLKGEDVNTFKELPVSIQNMITSYCNAGGIMPHTPKGNQFRNMVADELINDFIANMQMDRISHDFSKELEELFNKSTKEISEAVIGYTAERAKSYREAAEKMEDEEKKTQLLSILDNVDEGYNLTTLKEYATKCKIKNYELERPDKVFRNFSQKYASSKYNIYGIDMAIATLKRNINLDEDRNPRRDEDGNIIVDYDETDLNAFFIAFCKQTQTYNPNENVNHHAYMYYVLYNSVFTDINTGDSKNVSYVFMNNVKEVIDNLRKRNNNFGR